LAKNPPQIDSMSYTPDNQNRSNILIVDDTPDNLRFLSQTLSDRGYKVRSVIDGQMALTVARSATPDLILLDIKMPDLDGYEVCRLLKADKQTCEIPVIFLSALDEVLDKVTAFGVGGVDYITKPFQLEEVFARIENQLSLLSTKKQLQQLNAELEQRVFQRTAQLEQEIAGRLQAQEKLLHIALNDPLTGLPNRAFLIERLQEVLNRAQQHSDYLFAVLLLDCDRFKVINNSLGHPIGDQLLVAVARRLESYLRPGNTLARIGGDEFGILLEEVESLDEAIHLAEKLQTELEIAFHLAENNVSLNASIGIVLATSNYHQPEHILRDADTAMYQAKAKGKARYQVFEPDMYHRAMKTLTLETDLRQAIANQEFSVHYQPIVRLADSQIIGVEALVRWYPERGGVISPGDFVPVAEESGLIIPIDRWVLRQSCQQLFRWQQQGLSHLPLSISVNLSAKHFTKSNLVEQIDLILQETQLDCHSLNLEITESAIIQNETDASRILEQLKERQIKLTLDDFGTGFSSLSYLHRFPIDAIKIDRSFVSERGETIANLEIVRSVLNLAHSLGIEAIAEGIETAQQLAQLKELGCEYGQGYFFFKPLDAKKAEQVFAAD
jgi:diguanylate cyclase (GGDEF)-like protein